MTIHKLAELSGWELEDKDQDIRERPLISAEGKEVGVIKDLVVDLRGERVTHVVTSMGESYVAEDLEIEPDRVVARHGPVSGGTSKGPERSLKGEPDLELTGYRVRIIRIV